MGCTQSDISRYKMGRIPSGEKLVALAAALGCTAESLFQDDEFPSARVQETPPIPEGINWKERAIAAERKLAKLRLLLEEP